MKLVNPEVRFEVTNMCNSRCIMCPREKMTRPVGVMDMRLYKRVLDEAVELGAKFISLEHYGEPLLDPHLFERAAYARSKGLKTYTITNGALLDEEKGLKILKHIDKVRISIYAVTKECYEKVHKGLSYEKVKANVDAFLNMHKNAKGSKPTVEMCFVLLDENQNEMQPFIDKYKTFVDGISVWKPHNWADGRTYRRPLGSRTGCNRPLNGPLQIQWDGLIVPCVFDYDNKIILGDLKKETIAEVLNGAALKALRRAHERKELSQFPLCDACEQMYKDDSVLVYTNVIGMKVGATNTTYFDLKT